MIKVEVGQVWRRKDGKKWEVVELDPPFVVKREVLPSGALVPQRTHINEEQFRKQYVLFNCGLGHDTSKISCKDAAKVRQGLDPYAGDPVRWRVGRKVGRTIYEQIGDEPSYDDPMIGAMDTPELARDAVRGHNSFLSSPSRLVSTCERCDTQIVGHINGTWRHAPGYPGPCPRACPPEDAPPVTPREFLRWLISMDDPDNRIGMQDRQAITLTKIINRARAVLGIKEES